VGLLEAAPLHFERADAVPHGGVLLALPALLAQGLLQHTRDHDALPAGFYPLETIFLTLARLALARCPSLEPARYTAPGEWGRLLGLDRIPEVKTLREKLTVLCAEPGRAARWSAALARKWMGATAPDSAGVVCADGQVRVDHGGLTALPRRYVARQKLCLRGTRRNSSPRSPPCASRSSRIINSPARTGPPTSSPCRPSPWPTAKP